MLTEAIIQTSTPTSLKIDGVSQDEILILESISGLSDVKVNLFTGEFAREGGYYQGRRAEPRVPVFNFRIQPNYADNIMANKIREMLYRMFMEPQRDSDRVQVLLKDNELPDRYFIGYTETIQADMFAKEMRAQVGLKTTDAYLRSAQETILEHDRGWFAKPLKYEGSADTGVELSLQVLRPTSQVVISNGDDALVLDYVFKMGDTIDVSSVQGSRRIHINGVDRMVAMTPTSRWLTIRESQNMLRVRGATENDGSVVLKSVKYRAAWWGI